jgi:hypothetical protein
VLWKAMAWRRATVAERRAGLRLGPWPVHPDRVRTPEELIRAFEYLAVLCLGTVSRSWNHRAIAAGLTGEPPTGLGVDWLPGLSESPGRPPADDEQRLAATQLAALYEQARYAPPGEPLPEAALAAARRDLCLLGGVPVA